MISFRICKICNLDIPKTAFYLNAVFLFLSDFFVTKYPFIRLTNKQPKLHLENFSTSHHKMLRLACRITGNSTDAEDIVQDCYEKFILKKDHYNLQSSEAFLMAMVRNASLDFLRKKHYVFQSDEVLNHHFSGESPDKILELKEHENKLDQLLNLLNEKQRTVYHLREIEGYELEEIAEVLAISYDDVRTCLSRARKKIRELYNAYLNNERGSE